MQLTNLDSLLNLPYLDGQSSFYGADCLGFVSICYQIDLKMAYNMTLEEGIDYLGTWGFTEDARGQLVLMKFNGGNCWHLGIVEGDYIYHASKSRGLVVKDSLESFSVFIYKRFSLN